MLIGLAGYAYAGKDTVGEYLVKNHGFTRFAFADALKAMAYTLNPLVPVIPENPASNVTIRLQVLVNEVGWDNAKSNPEVRRILQVLGTECGRDIIGQNVWVDILAKQVWNHPGDIVITDVRFKNEVHFVTSHGQLWWIARDGVGPLNEHPSENLVSEEDANVLLVNNKDLDSLYEHVELILKAEG